MRYIQSRHGTLDLLYLLASDVQRRPPALALTSAVLSPDINLDLPGPCRRLANILVCTTGSTYIHTGMYLYIPLPGVTLSPSLPGGYVSAAVHLYSDGVTLTSDLHANLSLFCLQPARTEGK
jgi:hypothetical protein